MKDGRWVHDRNQASFYGDLRCDCAISRILKWLTVGLVVAQLVRLVVARNPERRRPAFGERGFHRGDFAQHDRLQVIAVSHINLDGFAHIKES